MDAVLAGLVSAPLPADAEGRLPLLLADFLGCIRASPALPSSFAQDGVAGTVALLALRASAADRDDIDWRSLHHPGSVVWPVVVGLAGAGDLPGGLVAQAARRGYLTAATVADLLGPDHRVAWHVTATAGALGAAAAASVLLGADRSTQERALALAAANVGGLARAARERRGAAAFNRAVAAGLGVTAARAAQAGLPAIEAPFDGPGGMRATMGAAAPICGPFVRDGLADAAPRLLPVSGFLQSAVAGAAQARGELRGDLVELRLGLTAGALSLVEDGAAGPWWDARTSVLRAWSAGAPYACDQAGPLDDRTDLVTLEAADVPVGHARVRATTRAGAVDLAVAPATLADADAESALVGKWARVLGDSAHDLVTSAREALDLAGCPGRLADW